MLPKKQFMKELKFLRNKVADKIVKPFKEIFIPPEQIEEILSELRQEWEWGTAKYPNY